MADPIIPTPTEAKDLVTELLAAVKVLNDLLKKARLYGMGFNVECPGRWSETDENVRLELTGYLIKNNIATGR